jgi:hypothetical protein
VSVPEAWPRALESAGSLAVSAGALQTDHATTLTLLREALTGVTDRRRALILVSVLPTEYTGALADVLVERALSHRDALLVRQIFGRLPRHEVVSVVPAAVWGQLAKAPDFDEYRRLAELLDYLGLDDALRRLCEVALESPDPEIRAVGTEFWPDGAPG